MFYTTLILLVIATLAALVDKISVFFKKSRIPIVRASPIILIILTLGFSIVIEFQKKDKEIEDKNAQEEKYTTTISNLQEILMKSNDLMSNIKHIEDSISFIADSLSNQLIIQRNTNIASMELLKKNRTMYLNMVKNDSIKLAQYTQSINSKITIITNVYAKLEFDPPITDSIILLRELRELFLLLQDVINSELGNPVLNSNPIISRFWIKSSNNLNTLNWALFGYYNKNLKTIKEDLLKFLRPIISYIKEYYLENNKSYSYPPKNKKILLHFNSIE